MSALSRDVKELNLGPSSGTATELQTLKEPYLFVFLPFPSLFFPFNKQATKSVSLNCWRLNSPDGSHATTAKRTCENNPLVEISLLAALDHYKQICLTGPEMILPQTVN